MPMQETMHSLHIGPAGWSYRDWIGPVYPPGRKTDQLLSVARRFNCIELNSSFYRIPGSRLVESWKERLAPIEDFSFTIKAWRKITHDRIADERTVSEFIHAFDPLIDQRRVGAFLLQFPWSFKNNAENRDYLSDLGRWFRDVPTAVELRNGSWNRPDTLKLLADSRLAFCNIDQPVIGDSVPPTDYVTVPHLAYIRLHGRNRKNWFNEAAGRDDRYDYLYGDRELEEWAERARRILSSTRHLYIITNNHFRGQALVNAFQLRAALENGRVEIMPELRMAYPVLERIAKVEPGQGRLL